MNLDDSLREKIVAAGSFEDNAPLAQAIKFAFRRGKNWEALSPEAKEALELIASNIAAILTGDPNNSGHWNSVATMARLREKTLETKTLENDVARTARIRTATPTMQRAIDELSGGENG
jgi:hypothetical protein